MAQNSESLRNGSGIWSHTLGLDSGRSLVPRGGPLTFTPAFHRDFCASKQKWEDGGFIRHSVERGCGKSI